MNPAMKISANRSTCIFSLLSKSPEQGLFNWV